MVQAAVMLLPRLNTPVAPMLMLLLLELNSTNQLLVPLLQTYQEHIIMEQVGLVQQLLEHKQF
jgi:hypothetical protein